MQSATPSLTSFEELVKHASTKREGLLYTQLMEHVRPIAWVWSKLSLHLTPQASADLIPRLKQFLKQETGIHWNIEIPVTENLPPTLGQRVKDRKEASIQAAMEDPLVKQTQALFPGMTLEDVEVAIGHA